MVILYRKSMKLGIQEDLSLSFLDTFASNTKWPNSEQLNGKHLFLFCRKRSNWVTYMYMYIRYNIPQDQFHSFTSTSTEVISIYGNLNVGMTVDISKDFFQQIETTLHTCKNSMCYFTLFVLFKFLLDVC